MWMYLCWYYELKARGYTWNNTNNNDKKCMPHIVMRMRKNNHHQSLTTNKCIRSSLECKLIEIRLLILLSVYTSNSIYTIHIYIYNIISTDNDNLLFNLISDLKFKVLWHVWWNMASNTMRVDISHHHSPFT